MTKWSPNSWRAKPIQQVPAYPDAAALNDVEARLATFPPLVEVKRGKGWDAQREIVETAATNGFLAEAEAFRELVVHGPSQWSGATPEESIDIAMTLEAISESARRNVAVDVVANVA